MLSNPPFRYIQIHVFPCIDSPLWTCMPAPNIINTKVKMGIIEKTVDFSKIYDPMKFSINFDQEYYLNPAQISKFSFFYKRNQIENDRFDFFKPTKVLEFLDEEKIIAATGFRDGSIKCSPLIFA